MANNPRFQQLPPARQQQIRTRLRKWNAMTPAEREVVREREEIQRLRALSPEEQERAMSTDPRFLRLSPATQRIVRQRLERWNAMTPDQQEVMRNREDIFRGLSAAQRQEARAIFPQWLRLSPERRQAVNQAFLRLRDLPPSQRQSFLDGPKVKEQFSPQEQHILEGLNKLLTNPPNAPPKEPNQ